MACLAWALCLLADATARLELAASLPREWLPVVVFTLGLRDELL